MIRAAGFTLLELMVAMVLLALLGLALAHGTRFGLQAWQRLDRTLDLGEPVALTQNFVRREIEQAQPIATGPGGAAAIAFSGSAAAVRFVASLPERAAAPGLDDIELRIAPSAAGWSLTMSWHPAAPTIAGGSKILIDGIARGSFAYFGSPDGKRPPDWQDVWENARTLPRLIALRLEFRDRRIAWPALLVAPGAVPDAAVPAA